MSKLIKIYDGMTFDMSTGAVLEHGEVTYHAEEDIAHCGGGGPSTQTTTSGFATEYKPEIKEMLGDAKGLYDNDKLGQVAGFGATGEAAQAAGIAAAGNQTALANNMMDIANQPVDLSGQRASALQSAQGALGTSQAAAGERGGLGGSRQMLNQAMGMQGQGAQTLGMIGQAQQAQEQAGLDSEYTALAQRIGLFSGVAPKEQNTTKTGGK